MLANRRNRQHERGRNGISSEGASATLSPSSEHMIRDGRSTGLPVALSYDLAIVGAGPAGITLAHEFAGTSLRVALIESGGLTFDDETQALYDGVVTGLDETDLTASRLRFFGGTSNHWGGHCLPLDPIDFDRAPLSGLTGWPFTRKPLEPFYRRAHDYCDIGAFNYSPESAAGARSGDLLLAGNASLETTVIRQSKPTRFGEKYAPTLRAAANVDVWLWTNLVDLSAGMDGRVTSLKTRTLTKVERDFSAKTVILACGAVENARLLLATNTRHGRSFGDAGGFLGACYMDHVTGGAAFLRLARPSGSKVYWNHDLRDSAGIPLHCVWRIRDAIQARERLPNIQFFLIPFPEDPEDQRRARHAAQSFAALKSMAKWTLGRGKQTFVLSDAYCNFITKADAFLAQTVHDLSVGGRVDRLLLRYEAELQPDRASHVTLGDDLDVLGLPKPILHWSPSVQDRNGIVRSAVLIGAACGAAELGRVELEDHFDARYWDATTAWHQMGTTRMAVSPSDGVVDPDCLVHGTQNLYIAGGSVMPTCGRANPTLTIVALALRLADHLKRQAGL